MTFQLARHFPSVIVAVDEHNADHLYAAPIPVDHALAQHFLNRAGGVIVSSMKIVPILLDRLARK